MSGMVSVCSCAKSGAVCSRGCEDVQIRIARFCVVNKEWSLFILERAQTIIEVFKGRMRVL